MRSVQTGGKTWLKATRMRSRKRTMRPRSRKKPASVGSLELQNWLTPWVAELKGEQLELQDPRRESSRR